MELDPHQMCLGLNLELDRQSVACFLRLFGRAELVDVLAQRMDSHAIEELNQFCTGVLKRHLSEDEYHQLFLLEASPHTPQTP